MSDSIITKGFRHGSRYHRRTNLGITVIELMLALSVGAIILALGIPGFSATTHKNRISATSSLLQNSLHVARGEAVKRRNSVRVCPTDNGNSCRSDGVWSDGWLIFEDANANNSPDASEIIRLLESVHAGVGMEVSATMAGYVQFEPSGAAVGNGGNTGEFRICHDGSNVVSQVLIVSATGHVAQQYRDVTTCAAG